MSAGWHAQDIIAAVRKRGTTLMAMSRRYGFVPRSFYLALQRPMPNAQMVIAHELEVSRHALWPQWYDKNDRPKFKTRYNNPRRNERLLAQFKLEKAAA